MSTGVFRAELILCKATVVKGTQGRRENGRTSEGKNMKKVRGNKGNGQDKKKTLKKYKTREKKKKNPQCK